MPAIPFTTSDGKKLVVTSQAVVDASGTKFIGHYIVTESDTEKQVNIGHVTRALPKAKDAEFAAIQLGSNWVASNYSLAE